ncbi:MAG: Spy/CpxP family protein refolding chaperone [Gemmatimonadales bacterium]
MIRISMLVMSLVAAGTTLASAQNPGQPPRAERLRQQIEMRVAEQLQRQLGLTDAQYGQTRSVLLTWARKRRDLERGERELRQTLAAQMRPGVAADEAVVTRTMNEILDGRIAYVQTFKDELAELSPILSPVQRAQYMQLRDRLMQRVQEIRGARGGPPGLERQ